MTRINLVPPRELSDKHLIAEYRELPRVFKLARHGDDIPAHYTLGRGHVKFFYNKLLFCINRQRRLVNEMKRRGFKPKFDPDDLWDFHEWAGGHAPSELWKDYKPTSVALAVNRQRIKERTR